MSLAVAERQVTILLADDDDDHRSVAADVLRDSGFTVIEAANGRVALDHLLNAPAEPDLILTDLNMPVITGWELITIARSYLRFTNVPIVLVTSGAMPAQACDEFNVGRLFKPYLPDELLAVVRARIGATAAAAGAPTSPAARR
jgi:CheY-like chemotaxis protein